MTGPGAQEWSLDPSVLYLNHGSFGSCPHPVRAAQRAFQDRLDRQPVQFLARDLDGLLDEAREALAGFVGADAGGLVFVTNATNGVNTVLSALALAPGDELLTTDHAYPACRNTLERIAARHGARVVTAQVPFPIDSPAQVVEALLAAVTRRTRIALVDHVTSPTALVWPVEEIVPALAARGIDTLVDGAHAPGMLRLDLRALGAAYYTANCHKWMCAPHGAAFLYVRADRRGAMHPLVTSHGATSPRTDRSRLHLEFDWTGTQDPTAWLAVPAAIRFLEKLLPGGIGALQERNRDLALAARDLLCDSLGIPPPCPASMVGSMASVPLPAGDGSDPGLGFKDRLQRDLLLQYGIEVPIFSWPRPPSRLLRISAQRYNTLDHYRRLVAVLPAALAS
jgi:isopenicillin-N epimerase